MAIRSQEKLDNIARLNSNLSQAKAQLQRARTKRVIALAIFSSTFDLN